MDERIRSDQIVLLLDDYSSDSQKLHQSFRLAGYEYPAAVIEDDGFLPEGVMSVYGFFLGDFKAEESLPGVPRYFNQITIPEYWEISGSNRSGSVHDKSRERGRIFYAEPTHKRLVKVVDWYDERGVVRSSDHYNRYGALYARTIFNEKGQKVNKSYFSADGKEVIVENFVTGDIILNEGEMVRMFRNKTEFVIHFLKAAGFSQHRVFFNSLSTPFFVSQRLSADKKKDVLFWQEPARDDIPGNMTIILNGQSTRTEKIMVQRQRAYDKLALDLPQIHFHIAALTEMSSKLMSMGAYSNVSLYPGVKMSVLDELFDQCDLYLDVNQEAEIVSAVYQAFLHNQIIFAFEETIHNRDCVAEAHIYPSKDVNRMISDIKALLEDKELATEHLNMQHEAALTETKETYQAFVG